jgi:hypothetical protein
MGTTEHERAKMNEDDIYDEGSRTEGRPREVRRRSLERSYATVITAVVGFLQSS